MKRIVRLLTLAVAFSMVGFAGTAAQAAPSPAVAARTHAPRSAPTPASRDIGQKYRQREQRASDRLEQFEGGRAVVILTTSGVVVLLVLLVLLV